MPVRNVSHGGGNVIGRFPSLKMERMIAFESLIERDFIYLLDYDPIVAWFEEQPLTIEYHYESKILHYTPDFHLLEQGQNVLVECKPDRFVDQDANRRKFAAARDWCMQHNWQFRIVTGRQVRTGFRLQNVKLLTQYARQNPNPVLQGRIYSLLHDSQSPLSINAVVRAVLPNKKVIVTSCILRMAFHHEISISVNDEPISGDSFISLPVQVREGGKP